MNAVSSYLNNLAAEAYLPQTTPQKTQASTDTSSGYAIPVDQVEISPTSAAMRRETSETGRIALNVQAGNLTSDQATQLYQQVASIQAQIEAYKQADGGTLSSQDAQTINELQSQLSASIYSDAHNGAAPPTTPPTVSDAAKREALEAGRIELNQQAGNLTSDQVQQLTQQQDQINQLIAADKQASGGTLSQSQAQQINQLQDDASKQIYQFVHGLTPTSA